MCARRGYECDGATESYGLAKNRKLMTCNKFSKLKFLNYYFDIMQVLFKMLSFVKYIN